MLWKWNRDLININYDLMKHNLDILRAFEEQLDHISAQIVTPKAEQIVTPKAEQMPGTMWVNTKTGETYTRANSNAEGGAKVVKPLKENINGKSTKDLYR